jgi:hypothetical protein
MATFKLKPWGPKRLRDLFEAVTDEINRRTPVKGIGIGIDETPTGYQISVEPPSGAKDAEQKGGGGGGGGGGTPTVLATEFVSASNGSTGSDEILYSHSIGANRLVADGDSIRAIYGLLLIGGTQTKDVFVNFGDTGSIGDFEIADGTGFTFTAQANIKIEVLIIRSGDTSYRYITTITVSLSSSDAPLVRCAAGGVFADGGVSSFEDNQFLTLWGGVFGGSAAAGQIEARLALIEYIPA